MSDTKIFSSRCKIVNISFYVENGLKMLCYSKDSDYYEFLLFFVLNVQLNILIFIEIYQLSTDN